MTDETTQTTTEETTTPTAQETLEKALDTPTSTTPQTDTTDESKSGEGSPSTTPEGSAKEDASPSSDDSSPDGEEFEPITPEFLIENVELPEGFEILKDDPLMQEFVSLLNEEELTVEDLGPKLVGLYAKATQANMQKWFDTQEEWLNELKNDPNIGGDKLEPAAERVSSLVHDYASTFGEDAANVDEALRAALDLTGAGNNPAIVRFLHWAALQLGEGAPLSGGSTGGERSRAERMYGTQ